MKRPRLIPTRRPRPTASPREPHGLLAQMRIRKKLIVLHTIFSLMLTLVLLGMMRPALDRVLREAEREAARVSLKTVLADRPLWAPDPGGAGVSLDRLLAVAAKFPEEVRVRAGDAAALGIPAEDAEIARASPGVPVDPARENASYALVFDEPSGMLITAESSLAGARRAALRLYVAVTVALLAVYALIALSLEVFVLPQHVYGPIRQMLLADRAAREGLREQELVPEQFIPRDELGEIITSRNQTVAALRRHERDLATALGALERVANDLKRKNHLLETAQRNLADADRLASLGMMSAGLAHELNTPLAVLKGLTETIASRPDRAPTPEEAALMRRVVGRLERLGESLLDFARVRPPATAPARVHAIVDEAITLVRLDRGLTGVEMLSRVEPDLIVDCDADRMVQVLVNLLRNAADALVSGRRVHDPNHRSPPRVTVESSLARREGSPWVSITVSDNGPGIDPEILGRLFEPFVSTRLDSRGTGLGLAVSEGIVREHGGILLARNLPGGGAAFEIMLPQHAPASAGADAQPEPANDPAVPPVPRSEPHAAPHSEPRSAP